MEADPPARAPSVDLVPQAQIGMRNFAEINASMAAATTVPITNSAVKAAFEQLKQQLPAVTNLDSFVASNQMAVTQMAIKYCDQLVESSSLRSAYFPDFNFNQAASTAFTPTARDAIVNVLSQRMLCQNLLDQPEQAAVNNELNDLITRLTDCSGGKICDANYTRTVVKAVCAATLGSAALLVQ